MQRRSFSESRITNHFDPANHEQRLMKELWEEATESEQKVLASLMTRLVEK